jgi:electron transport complex protein RnfD
MNGQAGLTITALPHLHSGVSVARIMYTVLIALAPAAVLAAFVSGPRVGIIMALSMSTAAAAEWIILCIIQRRFCGIDGSALVTGALLALVLPPHVPLWMAPLGALFGIALVKAASGGLGRNFLNPALAAKAFLVLAYPAMFAAVAGNTGQPEQLTWNSLLYFCIAHQDTWLGAASPAALVAGAVFLMYLRVIDRVLPLAYIGSAILLFWATGESSTLFTQQAAIAVCFQLCSGGVLIVALFMATDPVTSPALRTSRLFYGMACGVLTVLFSMFGAQGHAVMYAVLVMSCMVPLLNRWCAPGQRGHTKDDY